MAATKELPGYEMVDVCKHDSEGDAWLVIEGFVHDVTAFLHEHPGGKDIMMDHLGKDATEIFNSEQIYRIGVVNKAQVIDRTIAEDLSKLVDVTKPILPQIPALGAKYSPWIHSQMGLKEITIFDNFLENFSRYPWWYIFIMWPPFILFALNVSAQNAGLIKTPIMFFYGALSWALIEYILHRFVFHLYTTTTFWTSLIYQVTNFIRVETGIHGYLAGIAFGFMLYDAIHFYFHHGDAPWLPEFLKRMKSAHLNHHYKDDTSNFGVTSQLFDYICGTKG